MDAPWVTTTGPTWLDIIIIVASSVLVSYPISYMLVFSRVIKVIRSGESLMRSAFRRANAILWAQIKFAFIGWILAVVVCHLLFVLSILIFGLLAKIGLKELSAGGMDTPTLVLFRCSFACARMRILDGH